MTGVGEMIGPQLPLLPSPIWLTTTVGLLSYSPSPYHLDKD